MGFERMLRQALMWKTRLKWIAVGFLMGFFVFGIRPACAQTITEPTGSTATIPVTVSMTGLSLDPGTALCFGANVNAETGQPRHACSTGKSGSSATGTCVLTGMTAGDVIHSIYAWSWTDCTDGVFSGNTWWNQSGLNITLSSSTPAVTSTTADYDVAGFDGQILWNGIVLALGTFFAIMFYFRNPKNI